MNKKHLLIVSVTLITTAMLSGCGVELLATTAVRGELEAQNAKSAMKQLNYVKGKVGSINVDQAIQAYRADKGVNPPSLEAMVPTYLAAVPTKPDGSPYGYDPATGKLLDSPLPATSMVTDTQRMEQIRQAINQYGTAIGYYPPTLDALYPQYLSQLPRTSSGQQFVYNNQNGYLALPAGQAPAPAAAPQRQMQRPMGGGSGVGPMGEVMTGIGMQQQLNSMGSSGANAAQTRSRGGINDLSHSHTNTQTQVMDQLGL